MSRSRQPHSVITSARDLSGSPLPRRRGRPPKRNQEKTNNGSVQDSGEASAEAEGPFKIADHRLSSTTKILEAVAVPLTRPWRSQKQRDLSETLSSISSSLSSGDDEYDTPETSAAVTPAEFGIEGRKMRPLGKIDPIASYTPSSVDSTGKRKRAPKGGTLEQVRDDAMLAQALQEEEYSSARPVEAQALHGRKSRIPDSEDEADESAGSLSVVHTEDLPRSRASSIVSYRHRPKRVKTNGHMSLPSRAARDSARKSIAEKTSLHITNDDDDEDEDQDLDDDESILSEYDSDLDPELSDDSDVVTENQEEGSADVATLATASAVVPSRRPPRRHRGLTRPSASAPQPAVRNNASRRSQWLSSRVSRFPQQAHYDFHVWCLSNVLLTRRSRRTESELNLRGRILRLRPFGKISRQYQGSFHSEPNSLRLLHASSSPSSCKAWTGCGNKSNRSGKADYLVTKWAWAKRFRLSH